MRLSHPPAQCIITSHKIGQEPIHDTWHESIVLSALQKSQDVVKWESIAMHDTKSIVL